MFLVDALKKYVSATPASLQILRELQAENDKQIEESKNALDDSYSHIDTFPFDPDDDNDLPF